jgi:hypothetical protein
VAATAAARPAAGLLLGRYRTLRPLGTGGSGSVWLALDERTGREVALKVVSRDGIAGDRAEREAAVAARLRHPSCQRTIGLTSDDRHVYIVSEYVPGRTLRDVLRAGELPETAAIEAAAQILQALAHAHRRGIVHRDVKPANVLLADGAEVSARLLDFGLAQLAGAEALTAAGHIPGTLAYISPERLEGDAAGPASDVWAVGVMLWEALAGWHPFRARSLAATAEKIKEGAPPLGAVRKDLPRSLLASVDRALEREPARRPSAGALAEDLRRTAGRRAPAHAPPQARPRPPAWPRVAVRVAPPLLAALFVGWTAATFPFFPSGGAAVLAAAVALAMLAEPRAGLAFALAVPVLPLGNVSRGLALLYLAAALAWFLVHARRPRWGLLFCLGPLLAPLYALGALPLAVQAGRGRLHRCGQAAAGVLAASVVWGPRPVSFAGADSPISVAAALARSLADRPGVIATTAILGGMAFFLPIVRQFPPALAALAAAASGALVVAAPGPAAAAAAVWIWLSCAAVAARDRTRR